MHHGCGLQSAYKNRRYAPDLFLPIITQDFSPGTREGPMGLSEGLRGPGRAWDSEEPTAAPTHQLRLLVLLSSDRKSTRLNSSHVRISYAVFCLKKKKKSNHAEPSRHITT